MIDAFLETAKPLCEIEDGTALSQAVSSHYGMLQSHALELEAAAAKLELAVHGQLICVFYSIYAAARENMADTQELLRTLSSFVLACDPKHLRAAGYFTTDLCRNMVTMAGAGTIQQKLGILRALRSAVEKFRPSPEHLTPLHSEFLRACLKAEAYHVAVPVLSQPIYDLCPGDTISASLREPDGNNCGVQAEEFLSYWYYGALIWIALKEFQKASNMLVTTLICPSQTISTIQVDAYKKFVLLGLNLTGEVPELPKYVSQCVHRLVTMGVYGVKEEDRLKTGSIDYVARLRAKMPALVEDANDGLAKQVIASLEWRKVCELTKTYTTLSVDDIRKRALPDRQSADVEAFLVDMISKKKLSAKLDQANGVVSFMETGQDIDKSALENHLQKVMDLSRTIAIHEHTIFEETKQVTNVVDVAPDPVRCP